MSNVTHAPWTILDPTTPAAAVRGPVLLASDGRGPTDAPALAARRIAERLGAPVEVVAVLPPLPVAAMGYEIAVLPPELDAESLASLGAGVRRRLEPVLGPPERWRLDVRPGSPGRVVADVARERGAGLIVVGSGGHRAIDRLLGDEVSLQVVRHASTPVLAVAADLDRPIRRAVVGVDFGAASIRAARVALALLDPGPGEDAQLTLLHVRSPLEDMPPGIAAWAADYDARVATMFARLRELLHPLVGDHVTLETRARTGAAAECLRAAADETAADLVAVGTRGPGWAERLFVGSVAAAALRRSGRSVLVAPTPRAAERVRLELRVWGHVALERGEDWAGALDAFTRRNMGRPVRLEVGGHAVHGLLVEADRHRLVGAAYDPHDDRVEIMLAGDDEDPGRHLTHGITRVRAVEILGGGAKDRALIVDDDGGETVLTFLE